MRDIETICGDRGEGLATATLSYIKKCVAHCSLMPPFPFFCLSLSISFFLSLSWPFNSLKRYCEGEEKGPRDGWKEGGLFYPLLSVSLVPAEQKHQLYHPVCVSECMWARVCACVWASEWVRRLIVEQDINNRVRLFTDDSAVNNLNRFPFENRLFF